MEHKVCLILLLVSDDCSASTIIEDAHASMKMIQSRYKQVNVLMQMRQHTVIIIVIVIIMIIMLYSS